MIRDKSQISSWQLYQEKTEVPAENLGALKKVLQQQIHQQLSPLSAPFESEWHSEDCQ
jgi:hypothetical protein